jgi:hypothetical protein
VPEKDQIEIYGKPINNRLQHAQSLSDHQQASSIDAVCDRSAYGPEKQPGQGVEEPNHAEEKWRAGQLPHEPALRDVLHEVASVGEHGAHQQEAEITMAERTKGSECRKISHGPVVIEDYRKC